MNRPFVNRKIRKSHVKKIMSILLDLDLNLSNIARRAISPNTKKAVTVQHVSQAIKNCEPEWLVSFIVHCINVEQEKKDTKIFYSESDLWPDHLRSFEEFSSGSID